MSNLLTAEALAGIERDYNTASDATIAAHVPALLTHVRQLETQQRQAAGAGEALLRELKTYLDGLVITGDNIGDVRRSCFVPWESKWNGVVRDETASREKPPALDVQAVLTARGEQTEDEDGHN